MHSNDYADIYMSSLLRCSYDARKIYCFYVLKLFFFKLISNFIIFLDYFNVLMLKINFKNFKKYYLYIFSSKKTL